MQKPNFHVVKISQTVFFPSEADVMLSIVQANTLIVVRSIAGDDLAGISLALPFQMRIRRPWGHWSVDFMAISTAEHPNIIFHHFLGALR